MAVEAATVTTITPALTVGFESLSILAYPHDTNQACVPRVCAAGGRTGCAPRPTCHQPFVSMRLTVHDKPARNKPLRGRERSPGPR